LAGAGPVNLPAGGSAKVELKVPLRFRFNTVQLELSDPPKGLSLGDVAMAGGWLSFLVKADGQAPKPGYADNLIIEAFAEVIAGGGADAKTPQTKRRVSLGMLPATPFRIVPR
jgi:hypothetical protein